MSDIDIDLWMAQQSGLNDMYRSRVENNSIKTIDDDLGDWNEEDFTALKSINLRLPNSFQPMTMEQDINRRYASLKAQEAAKFGYNPAASGGAKILSLITKVEYVIQKIMVIATAMTIVGIPIALLTNVIIKALFNMTENWVKILDIRGLVSSADRQELMALVDQSKDLQREIKKYPTYKDMPEDVQDSIRKYVKANYVAANNMKEALAKVKDAYKNQ